MGELRVSIKEKRAYPGRWSGIPKYSGFSNFPKGYLCKHPWDPDLDQNEAQEGTGFINVDALLSKVKREDTKAVLFTKQVH